MRSAQPHYRTSPPTPTVSRRYRVVGTGRKSDAVSRRSGGVYRVRTAQPCDRTLVVRRSRLRSAVVDPVISSPARESRRNGTIDPNDSHVVSPARHVECVAGGSQWQRRQLPMPIRRWHTRPCGTASMDITARRPAWCVGSGPSDRHRGGAHAPNTGFARGDRHRSRPTAIPPQITGQRPRHRRTR